MLALALTVTEDVSHRRGRSQYTRGQTVFVRKRKGDRVRVTGPRNGRASYVTRWLDARQVEHRELDPTHVPDVPLLMLLGA